MKTKKLVVFILIVAAVTLCFASVALADFGDFGGVSDFGGDMDFGGSFDGYDSDYDSDYGGGFLVFYASDGSSVDYSWIFFVGIFALIVLSCVLKARKIKRTSMPGADRTPSSMLSPIGMFYEQDPEFNEQDFKAMISNLYIRMQNCWTNKDISELRPNFTDTLYSQFDGQLDSYRRSGLTNYVERIAVMGMDIRGWFADGENNNIVVSLRTRIVDYVTDDKTGKVVRGDANKEKFMEYEYTLQRPKGVMTTGAEEKERTVNCPNCGAPLEINVSAKCPYCGSIVTVKGNDWIIANIKAVSQRTQK